METIKRILQDKITDRIAPGKAVLIFGARRVGKTVMMRNIVNAYSGRTMMLNGEDTWYIGLSALIARHCLLETEAALYKE